MPRIALLTMSPWESEGGFKPFSLAVWRLKAALLRDSPDVEVKIFDANDWSLDAWQAAIEDFAPDIVGVSAYVWSFPTFAELSRRLSRPDRWLIFGGPSARQEMLTLSPYADAPQWLDAFCFTEGESVMTAVAACWPDRTRLLSLPGLAAWDGARWSHNARPLTRGLSELASPYQMGLLPPGTTAQLETFRGCPMSCSFCQWGILPARKEAASRAFLIAELSALKAMGANEVFMVDAALNLHSSAFTALSEAEAEVGLIAGREFVTEIYPTRLKPAHLDLLASAKSFVGIGLQSTDRDAMRRIGRPYTAENFQRAIAQLSEVAMTTIEIIVGLPDETPERFWETFEHVLRLPVSVRVFQSLILPDAGLLQAQSSDIRFDPRSMRMLSSPTWNPAVYRETLAAIHRRAVDLGGWYSRSWPSPAHPDDPLAELGRPLGGPMWTIPDHTHERHHRLRVPG
ncbi:MAG: radical SAM protein [Myxococcota bacterium]|nr:radical SAM protein [Myxococcota bacterium]